MRPDCIFCRILAGQAPGSFVYRDEVCTAFMDINPINPGHLLVVPNLHATDLAELPEATGGQLFRVAQRLARALRQSDTGCEGINLFLADGEVAGQEAFHVHLHVIPRAEGDGFGVKLPERYFSQQVTREALDRVAEQIRQAQ